MKNNNIRPNGLKGNEALNRMKSLMGISSMNENTIERSVIELTKIGPDGKVYGIVRENHEYYIKISNKSTNIVAEDFQYIGGLANKKEKAYPSYAKALKQLNLSFISISEAMGTTNNVNAFLNDKLIKENEEGVEDMVETDEVEGETPIEETEGATGIVRGAGHDTHIMEIEDDLTDTEKAIDEMITDNKDDVPVVENFIQNTRLKIGRAVEIVNEGDNRNTQVKTLIESLSENEKAALIEALKKKA